MASNRPVVVVTGSSTGIGLDLCLVLARRNYTVVATLRTPSNAPDVLRNSDCHIHELDVTSLESANALVSYLQVEYGGCDVLVNNAGYGIPGTLEIIAIDRAKQVFEVNVWGAVRMVQVLAPLMRERGGGLLLTVSSTSGWRATPCTDIYTGSKFAIEGMMEGFRYVLQTDNIKVCMVNPGPTDTNFRNRYRDELKFSARGEGKKLELQKRMTEASIGEVDKRHEGGQKSEDCAEAIADVVDRELPKKIDEGSDRAMFSNPTGKFGKDIIRNLKVSQDGSTGVVFDPLFERSMRLLNQEKDNI